jgi:N-acylglucosamine 2-epimerase
VVSLSSLGERDPGPPSAAERHALGLAYRRHLEERILPFWLHGPADDRRGGVFTCLDDRTGERISDDKYVWSQGRFAWLMAHAARMADRGLLGGEGGRFHELAERTASFLLDHAILADGTCAFVLEGDGTPKEHVPGAGLDASIFADCFVALGLGEVARLRRDLGMLDRAVALFDAVQRRIGAGEFRTEPYPVPAGYRTHAIPMIVLGVAQELARAAADLGHGRQPDLRSVAIDQIGDIMGTFVRDDLLVDEVIPDGDRAPRGRLLTEHVNPGHTIESMWFVIESAHAEGLAPVVKRAASVMQEALRIGWDGLHGGLLRFVDRQGGPPSGTPTCAYERLILDTWDTKIWWPHAEALYGSLLACHVADDPRLLQHHDRMLRYTMSAFPNPNRSVGEWIQVRDRRGAPLSKVVALPVKDPFHIARALMLSVELCAEGVAARTTSA